MTGPFIPLPSLETLKKELPLSEKEARAVSFFRLTSARILSGKEKRLAIFSGPCSIHNPQIALEYANRLKALSLKVNKHLFLVMRVFLEKPRTHLGWKGFLYDPFLDGSCAIEKGVYASRDLLIQLAQMNVPVATEFLDPNLSGYIQDLVSWGVIGARTTASPIHRQLASQLPMPVGFKNAVDGSTDPSICGALAARHPQLFIGIDQKGSVGSFQTSGNPSTHVILRGSQTSVNYDPFSIDETLEKQKMYGLNAPLLVDCSHGNSQKDPKKQPIAFQSVVEQILEGNRSIVGMLLESHLKGGNALSLTDPCLDWETTESLILWAYYLLDKQEQRVRV